MTVLAGTLGQIALFMEVYLRDPMGEEYWRCCDEAGDAMQEDVETIFLTACMNFKISQISFQAMHVDDHWAAFFSSAVMAVPLDGH